MSSMPSFTSSTMSFKTPPLSPSLFVPAEDDVFPGELLSMPEFVVPEAEDPFPPPLDADSIDAEVPPDVPADELPEVPLSLFLPHAAATQIAAISIALSANRLIFSIKNILLSTALVCTQRKKNMFGIIFIFFEPLIRLQAVRNKFRCLKYSESFPSCLPYDTEERKQAEIPAAESL
jgi:hypothetical protein